MANGGAASPNATPNATTDATTHAARAPAPSSTNADELTVTIRMHDPHGEHRVKVSKTVRRFRGAEGRSARRRRANARARGRGARPSGARCEHAARGARREKGEPLDGQRVASAVGFFGLLSLSLTTRRRTRTAAMGSMGVF